MRISHFCYLPSMNSPLPPLSGESLHLFDHLRTFIDTFVVKRLLGIEEHVDSLTDSVHSLTETVDFMKETTMTKDELDERLKAFMTREEVQKELSQHRLATKKDIQHEVDRAVHAIQAQDVELRSLRHRFNKHELQPGHVS